LARLDLLSVHEPLGGTIESCFSTTRDTLLFSLLSTQDTLEKKWKTALLGDESDTRATKQTPSLDCPKRANLTDLTFDIKIRACIYLIVLFAEHTITS
jgi:hypothetical protein